MAKYGKYKLKGFKMTITLEESYIEEISSIASETGKTKTKVVREALQTYTPANLHPSETYTKLTPQCMNLHFCGIFMTFFSVSITNPF
jgi:hypothetical protein